MNNMLLDSHNKIEQFPEYKELKERFKVLDQGIENPYFRVNDGKVNNKTSIAGKEYICFSSYNYLGLSGDERVSNIAKEAIDYYGTSVSASRIVTGERPIHGELEKKIAEFLGTEDSIVFVSGYLTNLTVIGHLLREKDLIIHDSLCHNSIIRGCFVSEAKRFAFPHNNIEMLDKLLYEVRDDYERILIVIEGVYSMEGDIPDVPALIELKKKYKALLYIDEAHSIGTLGENGRGIGEYFNIDPSDVDLWMGTLSKSFASCGGYISSSIEMVEYLRYTVPGFTFSVGLSPPDSAAALAALKIIQNDSNSVKKLQKNSKLFLKLAKERKLNTGLSYNTPVVPIIIGDTVKSLKISNDLFTEGINVNAVLYPSVPKGFERLRFFITCDHTEEELVYTIDKVEEVMKKYL